MKAMVRLNSAEVLAANKMMSELTGTDVELGTTGFNSEALTTKVKQDDGFTVIEIDADADMVTDFTELLNVTLGKYMALIRVITKHYMSFMDKWFKKED